MPERDVDLVGCDEIVYMGETVFLAVTGVDYDGATALTPIVLGETSTVTVTIEDTKPIPGVWVISEALTWNVTTAQWEFYWNTAGPNPAPSNAYSVKVIVTDSAGRVTFAFDQLFLRSPLF